MSGDGFVPGALAVVVNATSSENNGKIVTLLYPVPKGYRYWDQGLRWQAGEDSWMVRSEGGPLRHSCLHTGRTQKRSYAERNLKIIGNPTGPDETLEWVPSPIITLELEGIA